MALAGIGGATALHLGSADPVSAAIGIAPVPASVDGDWTVYGHDECGQRLSPLQQITAENAGKLERVWTYRTGFDAGSTRSPFEPTPLKIGDTPASDVIALDTETGTQRWRFNAQADREQVAFAACRGVSY